MQYTTCSYDLRFHILGTEDLSGENAVSAGRKLDDLIHLAELCVDLLQQNEEHHSEVSHTV